ncbi:sigma-70 family RNA polymerase sigma factor [Clostridium paraputrificum]|uniref:sigma-70 family RNA polymerase sigma factor n=1 Tax=Clostridium TaxID=1485 RepID=UPI003D352D77
MEDSFVIGQLLAKDENGIDNFIKKYGRLVYGVLNKVLATSYDKSEIEGVFYDVVLKIWNNIDCYDGEKGKFINFVISVAKYTAIDNMRKTKSRENLELKEEILSEPVHEDEYSIVDKKEEFMKLLIGLKDKDKDIFIRKYYLEQDAGKIAKDLGVSEEYIYTRLSRGRKKLKVTLGGELNGREGTI